MNTSLRRLSTCALSLSLGLTLGVNAAAACDLCAIFNEISTDKPVEGAVRVSVAEQFSYFGKVQEDGRVYADPANQHMASSITQFVAAYDYSPRLSLQANLPYISRHFRRFEDGAVESGVEAGIGDLTLLGNVVAFDSRGTDWTVVGRVFGGVKLPTGDSDRLAEEAGHHHAAPDLRHGGEDHGDDDHHSNHTDHGDEPIDPVVDRGDDGHDHGDDHGDDHDHAGGHGDGHHGDDIAHAIHGHDLALGSGSVDFPLGFSFLGQYKSFFVHADLQYLIRTEGDYDYAYANDLLWSFAPGIYLVSEHATTVSLAVDLSGEYKREDSADGDTLDDTAIRSIFIGPELRVSHGKWRGSLAWDKPVDINNSGIQAVVSDRVRASVSYWF